MPKNGWINPRSAIDKQTKRASRMGRLMYELEDAQEHLAALISEMNATDDFEEVDLRIQLAHVFSHLNRAWHRRDKVHGLNQEEWQDASRFPSDLDPS